VIQANKSPFLDRLLYRFFRRMARRAFHTIAGRGLEHLHRLPAGQPVILFCSHTNWWDGLICFLLTRHLPGKASYCMMEEKQLRHYRFFTWLGAFSVDLDHPVRSAASLRYARRLLRRNDTAIWIFPQGKFCRPNEPVEVRPGTDYLAKATPGALLVPLALRYNFFREGRPNVLIEIGPAFSVAEIGDGRIARECNAVLTRVSQAAENQDLTGFAPLFPPLWTINKRWEWIKRAATGRLRDFTPEN
jgi:1-acyl-sn-glycerol-3-phosphate acyltransferase